MTVLFANTWTFLFGKLCHWWPLAMGALLIGLGLAWWLWYRESSRQLRDAEVQRAGLVAEEKLLRDNQGFSKRHTTLAAEKAQVEREMLKTKADWQDLQSQMAGAIQELDAVRADAARKEREFSQFRADTQKKSDASRILKEQVQAMQANVASFVDSAKTREETIAELKAKLTRAETELATRLNVAVEWEGKLRQAKTDLQAKTEDAAQWESKLQAQEMALRDLEERKDKFLEEKRAMDAEWSAKLSDAESRFGTRTVEWEAVVARLETANKSVDSLKITLTDTQEKLDRTELDRRRILEERAIQDQEWSDKVAGMEAEARTLQTSLTERGDAGLRQELAARDLAVSQLQSNLAALEARRSELESAARAKEEAEAGLRQQVSGLASELAATRHNVPAVAAQENMDARLGLLYTSKPSDADDLKEIVGVGEVLERKLHEHGVYRFKQIARWNQPQIEAFSEKLDFAGRVEREEWVPQAARLHFDKYGEELGLAASPAARWFPGEAVEEDAKLGLVFREQPAQVDDLLIIKGIGPVILQELHKYGVYRFRQIALWSPAQVEEFDLRLDFKGRIEREEWIRQAKEFHEANYGNQ